jgi:nucleotide-binding universal stress UspA family protein
MADTIVVGHDGSEASEAAVAAAVDIAKDRAGSEIVIACAMHQPLSFVGRPSEELAYAAEKYLEEMAPHMEEVLEKAAGTVRAAGVKCATACMHGEPSEIVLKVAEDVGARLVVVGSTGAGFMSELLGSTTTRLLRKSKLPVVVVPKSDKK